MLVKSTRWHHSSAAGTERARRVLEVLDVEQGGCNSTRIQCHTCNQNNDRIDLRETAFLHIERRLRTGNGCQRDEFTKKPILNPGSG